MSTYGIVELFPFVDRERNKCGYCKKRESTSYGMWAHALTVDNYQDLTERGWRRSGMYCYKPIMKETCCPLYTIRCEALNFHLSKSQKSVLRRMRQFLITGNLKSNEKGEQPRETNSREVKEKKQEVEAETVDEEINANEEAKQLQHLATMVQTNSQEIEKIKMQPARHPCKKAKIIRMERRTEKLAKRLNQPLNSLTLPKKMSASQPKSLRDHIEEPLPPNAKHTLNIVTVRPTKSNKQFKDSYEAVFALYQKYQVAVHNDEPEHCTSSQFKRFLVDSPLADSFESEDDEFLGSFHQQYWLGKKLIAVGVIDILPKYVSSVYFFYDPDYSVLSLGNYGALREIAFTQQLYETNPELQYYLMGFYIHSCIKMRYKGQYHPSFLLCPETFTWKPIEAARKKLDVSKYSRLEDNPDIVDQDANTKDDEIMILYRKSAMTYAKYLRITKSLSATDREDVYMCAKLIGKKAASAILLYRS